MNATQSYVAFNIQRLIVGSQLASVLYPACM